MNTVFWSGDVAIMSYKHLILFAIFIEAYALQDCVCNNCNGTLTVGKVYMNTCYFITVDSRFEVIWGQQDAGENTISTSSLEAQNYVIASINTPYKHKLLKLISHEILLKDISTSLNVTIVNGNQIDCLKFHRYKQLRDNDTCESSKTTIMAASVDKFKTLPGKELPRFKECDFHKEAMALFIKDVCVTIRNDDEPCLPLTLLTNYDTTNLNAFLLHHVSESGGYKIKDLVTTLYKNDYFIVYSSPSSNGFCKIVDIKTKQIYPDYCNSSQQWLCEIDRPNVKATSTVSQYNITELIEKKSTPTLSATTWFAIIGFVSSVAFFVLAVCFCKTIHFLATKDFVTPQVSEKNAFDYF